MFWRVAGFTQPSPVETLLDKENFTLEELLDEDDLIQVRAAYTPQCWVFVGGSSPVGVMWRQSRPAQCMLSSIPEAAKDCELLRRSLKASRLVTQ